MINFNRVFTMVLRYFLYLRHNYDRLSDMFYWPAMDIFVWGLTGLYIVQTSNNSVNGISLILGGIVFWIVIWRGQYEINVNIMSEIWDKNLVNIIASPLKLSEWMLSLIIVGIIKMTISLAFSALIAFILYQYNIFMYGFFLLPAVLSLLLTGWVAGFFVAGLLILFGEKIQTLAWTGVAIIWPFCTLFYPISILPQWAQTVARFVPPSYIFENFRSIATKGEFNSDGVIISLALNVIYLLLSLLFFVSMFKKSRILGLGRLI